MHDDIRRFELKGQVSDDKLMQTRERLVAELEGGMRDEGFVPVLDLQPQFTRIYDVDSQLYEFTLSVYGVYLGEDAWQSLGMMSGLPVDRSIHEARSKQS